MTLDEIADLLATTTGAVKAALHPGAIVCASRMAGRHRVGPYRRRSSSTASSNGATRRTSRAWSRSCSTAPWPRTSATRCTSAAIGPPRARRISSTRWSTATREWPPQTRHDAVRRERVEIDGEPIMAIFATRWGNEALEVVLRFEEQDRRIARIRAYGFCPVVPCSAVPYRSDRDRRFDPGVVRGPSKARRSRLGRLIAACDHCVFFCQRGEKRYARNVFPFCHRRHRRHG